MKEEFTLKNIHKLHNRYIEKIVRYYIFNWNHHKDVKQDIYLRMGKELIRRDFSEYNMKLSTFVHLNAKWECMSFLKKDIKGFRNFTDYDVFEEFTLLDNYGHNDTFKEVEDGHSLFFLEQYIRHFKEYEQMIVFYRIVKGYNFGVIADKLGMKEQSIPHIYYRVLRTMKYRMTRYGHTYERLA